MDPPGEATGGVARGKPGHKHTSRWRGNSSDASSRWRGMMTKSHGKADKAAESAESATAAAQGNTELFGLLRQDHEMVRELLKRIEKSSSGQVELRQELFSKLEHELLVHMEAEERFFYTALEQHDESREGALESYEEHQVTKSIIGAFNGLAVDDARWPAKLRVLGQLVRRHEDEEEHKLFKVAKKVLGNDQLQGIAARVQDLRRERSAPKAAANVVSAQEGRRK